MTRTVDPEILSGFLEEAAGYLPQIRLAIKALAGPPDRMEQALEEGHRQIHCIKGAAAMVGLSGLSHIALQLEDAFENIAALLLPTDQGTLTAMSQGLDLVEAYLDQVKQDRVDEASIAAEFARIEPALQPRKPVKPAPAAKKPDTDEEEDHSEASDPELLGVFHQEAEDHLRKINALLPLLVDQPANREIIQEIRRSAHTLKGSGAMVGFRRLTRLAHRVEDLLDQLYEGQRPVTADEISLLTASSYVLEELAGGQGDPETLRGLYARFDELLASPSEPPESSTEATPDNGDREDAAPRNQPHTEATVRVPLKRVDELVQLVSEVVLSRGVLEQQVAAQAHQIQELQLITERLQRSVAQLETGYEVSALGGRLPAIQRMGEANPTWHNSTQMIAPAGADHGFDDLEFDRYTEFHLLLRALTETASDLETVGQELGKLSGDLEAELHRQARLSRDTQDRLMRVRMVPLDHLESRLRRTVRNVAQAQNKQIELILEGGSTELDKTMLEEMAEPLLHLLRNAADHGIEEPEARSLAGKNETGTIHIRASQEGNQVVLEIRDDGQGLNQEAIRRKAIALGFATEGEAAQLPEDELLALLFQPGFSTADQITEVSGRGVGLDIVQAKVQRLRGSLKVASNPGQGTVFTIRLPITLAIIKAVLVKTCGHIYAVPMAAVQHIHRLDPTVQVPGPEGKENTSIRLGERDFARVDLGQALQLKRPPGEVPDRPPVLVLLASGREVAVVVDQLLGAREIVVKSLGKHLQRVHAISGATLLGDGTVVPIINPADLLEAPTQPRRRKQISQPQRTRPLEILVVDDSPSVRRVVAKLLENQGWKVRSARDGLEALESLHQVAMLPDLMLVDVEMPRMDGYELIATVRANPTYAALPAVMITSRAGAKHRRKAEEVGANGYLVKPYQDEELLRTIRDLVPQPSLK